MIFYFLSFLLFMIVTTKTAKAIISVRLSKTVTRLPFPGKLENNISTTYFLSEEPMKKAGTPP
ncbi:hypothetical protein FZ082_14770 [Listeria monocytogenes]|nr:hypothetical protein FZ082_14770 [Listeria monocytogenes]